MTNIWRASEIGLVVAIFLAVSSAARAGLLPAGASATPTPTATATQPGTQDTVDGQVAEDFASESAEISQSSGASSASLLTVGPNVNISQRPGNQQEVAIAVNPVDPMQLFAFSNIEPPGQGLFAARSLDGGETWEELGGDGLIADGDPGDPLPIACCDPSASWDDWGNLFITYLTQNPSCCRVAVGRSTNGGQSFVHVATLATDPDQPTIATGPIH